MNPQGVSSVSAADVPQILTQEASSAAPITITDEAGSVVAASSLTALFNADGTYVGSYGIDPRTGAFAAWDADGNETNFQAFAAEHQLASGATPVASDGGSAVLYNSSGQLIGLDVAGYVVGGSADGQVSVYNQTAESEIATFGYNASTNDISLNGSSADTLLESLGFTQAQITQVGAQIAANGGSDLSDATQASMYGALVEGSLAGNTTGMGTVPSAVYNAQGGLPWPVLPERESIRHR